MFFSNDPKLCVEKLLVFGALGLYIYKHIMLKKSGELAGEPDFMLKVDKDKIFDYASKRFSMNPAQRAVLENIYDHLMKESK